MRDQPGSDPFVWWQNEFDLERISSGTPPFEERIIVAALFDIPVQRCVVNKDIKNEVTVFKMRIWLLPIPCLRISTNEGKSSSRETGQTSYPTCRLVWYSCLHSLPSLSLFSLVTSRAWALAAVTPFRDKEVRLKECNEALKISADYILKRPEKKAPSSNSLQGFDVSRNISFITSIWGIWGHMSLLLDVSEKQVKREFSGSNFCWVCTRKKDSLW